MPPDIWNCHRLIQAEIARILGYHRIEGACHGGICVTLTEAIDGWNSKIDGWNQKMASELR